MIIEQTGLDQSSYHQQRFNPTKLPDVHAAGPISASVVSAMRNPIKFLSQPVKPKTPDMAWGTLVDLLWLTPESFYKYVILKPSDAPKKPDVRQRNAKKPSNETLDAIAWWNEFEKAALGKMIIDEPLLMEVRAARDMLDQHPVAREIWNVSKKQVILAGVDDTFHPSRNPYAFKSMIDLLPMEGEIRVDGARINLNQCVVDLKQCHNVTPYGIRKAISQFEYHLKTKFYIEMVNRSQIDPAPRRRHAILIVQNSNPPYDVHIRSIDEDDLRTGWLQIVSRIDLMHRINPEDMRNLYDTEVTTVKMYDWMTTEED